jgi:hypothetical protein
MSKTHLPKQIREDPEIKRVFGDSTPKRVKKTWRTCENPNCHKWFLPRKYYQRFCCSECLHDAKRKLPKKQVICSSCGRHSKMLQDGLCSFCRSKDAKFRYELRELQKNPNKKKIYFKCDVCKSQVSRSFYEMNNGLCEECHKKRSVM